ncbi:MAG TPA: hypothetical protein VL523_03440 [Terriglobia bacterium]|nr:hypothetical protein [Terriglobia bacterium]
MRDMAQYNAGKADVVFEGEVEHQDVVQGNLIPPGVASITFQGVHRVVSVRILQMYRGPEGAALTVLTGIGGGDCGVDLELGASYLVFANRLADGNIFTSICTGTDLLSHSQPAVRLLRAEKPAADDLLGTEAFLEKNFPNWTGTVCGKVVNALDGSPVGRAEVTLWQPREAPFPQKEYSDENLAKPDGSFCIVADPGSYVLTGESDDLDGKTRLMGFYPGTVLPSQGVPLTVKAGEKTSGVEFALHRELLFTVRFRAGTTDGSPVPWKRLRVRIDSVDRSPLSYHEDQGVEKAGTCELGDVPGGHYTVQAFFDPEFDETTGQFRMTPSEWQTFKQEVDVAGDTEIIVSLARAK